MEGIREIQIPTSSYSNLSSANAFHWLGTTEAKAEGGLEMQHRERWRINMGRM
jgi:hypothetical protein